MWEVCSYKSGFNLWWKFKGLKVKKHNRLIVQEKYCVTHSHVFFPKHNLMLPLWYVFLCDMLIFHREIHGSSLQKITLVSRRFFALKAQPRWQILRLWVLIRAVPLHIGFRQAAAVDLSPQAPSLTLCKCWKMSITQQPATAQPPATPALHTWLIRAIWPWWRWRPCLQTRLVVV